MDHQDSRPNNDSRANRLPYHAEPRQGRFGRVENWREAEEKKIEELRQRRHAASRSSARRQHPQTSSQQSQTGYSDLQRQKTQNGQRGVKAQNTQPQNVQRKARPKEEVNPWQQGRFGRVENWREVEEQRRAQELELERQREAARRANHQAAQASKQQAAQQRQKRQSQEQAPLGAHSRQAIEAQQQAKRAQHTAKRQAVTAEDIRAASADAQRVIAQHTQTASSQAHYEETQSEPSGKLTAKSYARETYTSSKGVKPIEFNAGAHSKQSKYNRRPAVERGSGKDKPRRQSKVKKIISPKLIAIIAAVFIVIIGIGAFNMFSQSDTVNATGTGQTTGGTKTPSLPTPIMSESAGITMHSAVAMEDLTEILIHNASYSYANEITTQLPEATNTEVIAAHGTGRVLADQPTGDSWIVGQFIRCFRSGNAGPTMSAIDCGGPVGATVYAPVTGEVVLVKQYKLYGEIDDYRIHIQPTGRPDLDVVLIHLTDVTVKAGDKVTAGITPIARIRDLFQYLDESLQLKSYTAESDNGNHTHIQVNNANHPEYTALDELKPAPAANAQVSE